jgi:hypothetical protein
MNPQGIMLKNKKIIYCTIPLTWHFWNAMIWEKEDRSVVAMGQAKDGRRKVGVVIGEQYEGSLCYVGTVQYLVGLCIFQWYHGSVLMQTHMHTHKWLQIKLGRFNKVNGFY